MIKRYISMTALAALLVLMLSTCGTKTGSINGKVVSTGGAPVVEAIVEVAGTAVLTGVEGDYALENIPVGSHTIWATKPGVGNLTSVVTVNAGVMTQFDIVLQPVGE